jgi:hypothetical protein
VRRPAELAWLTVTEQSERPDLDCRRELLHARTIAGAILPFHQTNEPCTRPARPRREGACRRAGERTVIHAQAEDGIVRRAIYARRLSVYSYPRSSPSPDGRQTQFRSPGILRMSSSSSTSSRLVSSCPLSGVVWPWQRAVSLACPSERSSAQPGPVMSVSPVCSDSDTTLFSPCQMLPLARLDLRWEASIVSAPV